MRDLARSGVTMIVVTHGFAFARGARDQSRDRLMRRLPHFMPAPFKPPLSAHFHAMTELHDHPPLTIDFPVDPRVGEILDIVAKETDVDRAALLAPATLDELGIPSLDLTHALFAIETHFDIEIPVVSDQQGSEFATVGALVAHILATLNLSRANLPAATGPGSTAGAA